MIPASLLDDFINRHIRRTDPKPGIEIPALLAIWIDARAYLDPVTALDAVQRRLIVRGNLID